MVLPCDYDLRTTISAVKVVVAIDLVNRFGMSRRDVASVLGITEAAIAKYMNSNYSKGVARVVKYLKKTNLHSKLSERIASGGMGRDAIMGRIDLLASKPDVIDASKDVKKRG